MAKTSKSRRDFFAACAEGIVVANTLPFFVYAKPSKNKKTGYIYDNCYLKHQASPECPERLIAIQNRMKESGLDKEVTNLVLFGDPVQYIRTIHMDQHISSVQNIQITGEVAELAVAGAIGAVKAVSDGIVDNTFCAIRPPGHHAHDSGGEEGFCYFNNVAIPTY